MQAAAKFVVTVLGRNATNVLSHYFMAMITMMVPLV
jgi:hypothetical protein